MRLTQTPRRAACNRAARRAALFVVAAAAALPAGAAGAAPAWAAMPATLLPHRLPVADAGTDTGTATGWRLQAEAADFEADDATAVRDLDGDWARYHPRAGRNRALQAARLELSAARQGWELAAALRSEILIDGSRGAFDVVQAYKQRRTPADGSAFAVDARERGVVLAGLRVARSWSLGQAAAAAPPPWQLTAALTLQSVRRVQQVDAQGTVRYDLATGYAFDATTRRLDSSKRFAGFGTEDAQGQGASADLGLLWQPSAQGFVNLSVTDLWSRLRVRGVAREDARLSSATRQFDADGYLDYRPLISGRYTADALRWRLPRKTALAAGWRLDGGAPGGPGGLLDGAVLGARWEHVDGLHLPAVWGQWPLRGAAAGWALQAEAELRFRTLGLGLRGPGVQAMLRTRSLPVGQTRALGWQAAVSWPW